MKSDYLFLDVKESLIPNSGLGVFAKSDIKAGSFIVEYRGYSILFYLKKLSNQLEIMLGSIIYAWR